MIDSSHLSALTAVLRSGSFEAAATELGLTQPAVSHRIRALEDRVGAVLIQRGPPCKPTAAGRRLWSHAMQVAAMEQELARQVRSFAPEAQQPVRIAVTADCLATWWPKVMARLPGMLFDLVVDDQDHSADWLRAGEVVAALSAYPRAIRGCQHYGIGNLRYVAVASPDFVARWFPEGVTPEALARSPALTFNSKDALQARWAEPILGPKPRFPTHTIPGVEAFLDAAVAGLGWGLVPKVQAEWKLIMGTVVPLDPDRPLDVPLSWHVASAAVAGLRPLTQAVIAEKKMVLL